MTVDEIIGMPFAILDARAFASLGGHTYLAHLVQSTESSGWLDSEPTTPASCLDAFNLATHGLIISKPFPISDEYSSCLSEPKLPMLSVTAAPEVTRTCQSKNVICAHSDISEIGSVRNVNQSDLFSRIR